MQRGLTFVRYAPHKYGRLVLVRRSRSTHKGIFRCACGTEKEIAFCELAIEFESKAVDPRSSWLRLHYVIADQAIDDEFRLTTTRPHFGGLRWLFRCPATGRRVRKLFLRRHRFRSRTAHEFIYTSQQEDFPDRAARRARKIRRRLGGDPMAIRYPRKPPRMPRATYDQLLDKLAAAECIVENAANGRLFAGLARIESLTVDQLFDKLAAAGT